MKKTQNSRRIAIVADDEMRTNLIEWSYFNKEVLRKQNLIASEPAAGLLEGTLDVPVMALPAAINGHRELTRLIETRSVDIVIYFGNPARTAAPQAGINELLLLAFDHNILTACNVSTAELIVRSLPAA